MPNEPKPAIRMRGVMGPFLAMATVGITTGAALLPADLGISVEDGRLIIEIEQAVAAIATVLVGSGLGIYGRLRAETRWNGRVRR